MELELMYPEIIVYSLIAAAVVLLVWRKHNKFKNGVMVANTKYIKRSKYYKHLLIKYRIYNILIKVACILLIFVCSVLTARINKVEKHEEEFNNRDMLLCMDVSGSMSTSNREVFKIMRDIVSEFKDERFSIVLFNSSPVTVLPFTTDYSYALGLIDEFIEAYNEFMDAWKNGYNSQKINYILAGTMVGKGASLVGDGLAYCASSFKEDSDRSKIIIFTTDNDAGEGILTLNQAVTYSQKKNIRVFPIAPSRIKLLNSSCKTELMEVAKKTGGTYYDFSDYSTNDLAGKLANIQKSSMIRNVYVTRTDLPERIFPYLLFIIPILFLMEWRIRL